MKKNKRFSSLRFKDFETPFNSFIKVTWNGKVLFDDMSDDPLMSSKERCESVTQKYGEKLVYSMYINVVSGHHTELFIEGED